MNASAKICCSSDRFYSYQSQLCVLIQYSYQCKAIKIHISFKSISEIRYDTEDLIKRGSTILSKALSRLSYKVLNWADIIKRNIK